MAMLSPGAGVSEICGITAVPAVAMALGSAAVSMAEPSEAVQARLQRFSAGLLVGAVVTEIFPILKQHLVRVDAMQRSRISWWDMLAAVIGFGAALLLMYSLKALDLEGGEEEEAAEDKPGAGHDAHVWLPGAGDEDSSAKLRMWLARLEAHTNALARLVAAEEADREAVDEEVHGMDFLVDSARRLCRGAEPMDRRSASRLRHHVEELIANVEQLQKTDVGNVRDVERQLRLAGASLLQVHSVAEKATFRRWAPRPLPIQHPEASGPAVPRGLVVAVVVDSIVDGMLIGLAGAVASTSGWLMAAATTFEMGFLGYSFACSIIKAAKPWVAALILGLPPVAMLLSSAMACLGAGHLEHHPAFSGAIAFAMVAVLFLVFQELLVEAHEKEGGEEWHIGLWLYAGLLLSIHLDMFL